MKLEYSAEVSAEMLLNYFYPDMKGKWVVKNKGTFYRNYTPDILSIDLEEDKVRLSRDGYLKLLPQGLVTPDDELKKGDFRDGYDKMRRRLQLLQETFAPFDSYLFRRRLNIDSEVTKLLSTKLDYLLKNHFGFDRSQVTNPYIKSLSVLLPYASKLRGNFDLLKELLASLFDTTVVMKVGKYSETDNTKHWLPWARYTIIKNHLEREEYKKLILDVGEMKFFVREWFIPFDTRCDIMVKQDPPYSSTNDALILNYNTKLK